MRYLRKNNVWILGFLVGCISFVCIFGTQILDITYTDWLLGGGNITQNFLGWVFFRNSDWLFPIGLMNNITYPNPVSIIYTNSIPLCAIFFKLFDIVLPNEFQYFGLWIILCMGLQGAYSSLLIYHFIENKIIAVISSLFFVITPILLEQVSLNFALGAQWLILFTLYVGVKRKLMERRKKIIVWGMVGFLAGSIHLYFIPICGIIFFSFLLSDIILNKNKLHTLEDFFSYICVAIVTVTLLGGFSHFHLPDSTLIGQGSFNLNGFLNPQGWSKLIPSFVVYGENPSEGLAYPGTGILLLFVGLVVYLLNKFIYIFVNKEKCPRLFIKNFHENRLAFLILSILSISISLSPWITYGNKILLKIEYPTWVYSIWLRIGNCGRFIWPVVYLVILGCVIWLKKNIPWKNILIILLVLFTIVQVQDEKWQLIHRKVQFGTNFCYKSRLEDGIWEEWANDEKLKHIVFISNIFDDEEMLYSLSIYAAKNGMTVNGFKLSCQTVRDMNLIDQSKIRGNIQEDTLYVFKESDRMTRNDIYMNYKNIDGMVIGTINPFEY